MGYVSGPRLCTQCLMGLWGTLGVLRGTMPIVFWGLWPLNSPCPCRLPLQPQRFLWEGADGIPGPRPL